MQNKLVLKEDVRGACASFVQTPPIHYRVVGTLEEAIAMQPTVNIR